MTTTTIRPKTIRPKTIKTAKLEMCNRTGSYQHAITFHVRENGTVKVVERMIDEMMGDWIGNGRDRVIPVEEAREYYRDRKQFGYR
jgi:hypothetical protein